jgi:hypothetical protein
MSKSYSRNSFHSVLAGAALLAIPSLAFADETYGAFGHVTIPGNALVSFDISWVENSNNFYYLADRNNKSIDAMPIMAFPPVFQIIPTGVNAFAGTATCPFPSGPNDCVGPNGVITFQNADHGNQLELWTGDGNSTVKIFTVASGNTPTHVISTNGLARADELCFDPVHKVVVMANDAEPASAPRPSFVTFISTVTYQILAQVSFPEATNGIEQCAFNPVNNQIYLNIPEVLGPGDDSVPGEVVVFSAPGLQIAKFPFSATTGIGVCAGPQGMAIRANGDPILGCNAPATNGDQNSVIVAAATPNVIVTPLIGLGGADQVWFDPTSRHAFITGGSKLPFMQFAIVDSVLGLNDPQGPDFQQQTLPIGFIGSTTRRAHSTAAWSGTLSGAPLLPPLTIAFVPIPAVGGTPAPFSSTVCGNDAAKGCISFFASLLSALDGDD